MPASAQFRLLGDKTNWLEETTAQIYLCAERFRKLAVLCPDEKLLEDIDERLWQNAAKNFVSFAHVNEPESSDVNVLMTDSLDKIARRPAVINLGGEIATEHLNMQFLCEIVFNDDDSVAKARGQYKIYRQYGFHLEHHELKSKAS